MFDHQNQLFVNACKTSSLKFLSFCEEGNTITTKEWFLTAGSQNPAMQTWMKHNTRPGVSQVKITQSKLVCALGDLIRVYSFDNAD